MEYLLTVRQGVREGLKWRDGQLADKRPDGFHTGTMVRKELCVITDTEDYDIATGGSIENNWGFKANMFPKLKQDAQGFSKSFSSKFRRSNKKFKWEAGYVQIDKEAVKHRMKDYFIDYKELLDLGHINQATYDSIYDLGNNHLPINLTFDLSASGLIHHEDEYSRRD